MKNLSSLLLLCFSISAAAQTNTLTYAGNSGAEVFNDVVQLSNSRVVVIGVADDLDWISPAVPKTQLTVTGINNSGGTNKMPFILLFDSSLQNLLAAYHLPQGAAEDLRFIKTTNLVGQPTGAVYLSGNTTNGYFIGRLNANFVSGAPTGFTWVYNVYAKAGSYPKTYQPWDVGGDGKVVYATGDSHDYNWSAVYRLKADGSGDVVPNWRLHYTTGGSEYLGGAATYTGAGGISYSAIVFKRDGSRCELRSPTAADYNTWLPDGNGGTKKGKWPLDVLFNSHCAPGSSNATSGSGYTGYGPAATFTFGPSSVCIDKRNGHLYIGFNAKSVLPDGNPDFEPAVMAMDETGSLKWWSRLYHEVRPDGTQMNSSPDQYVDALAIDYSQPAATGYLVVGARSHGNNVENLWEGNTIAANPSATGFQNSFTGNSGNIHLSWLGKLTLQQGTLMHSSYMAELAEGATGLGTASTDPNLDGWPSPNSGWPTLNTTYMGKNNLRLAADGSVVVLGVGRRTITTANAYQKMPKPGQGASSWNHFVRVYNSALSGLKYSSLVVGTWDQSTGAGGDNVRLHGVWKTAQGVIAVGQHTGSGAQMPVANVPAWGNSTYNGASAVLAYYQTSNLANNADNAYVAGTVLPTRLLRFDGEIVNGAHQLRWATTSESANRGFYVQQSRDGSRFSDVALVNSQAQGGNSAAPLSYQYAVANPPAVAYYRLRQVSVNGSETLSNVVRLQSGANSFGLVLRPNPVSDVLQVVVDGNGEDRKAAITINNSVGRQVIAVQRRLSVGRVVWALDVQALPAGSYYLRVEAENGATIGQAFIKQ